MKPESYGSYMIVFALNGASEQFYQDRFIETLRFYKENGEIRRAELSRYRDVIVMEISCTLSLYKRMITAINRYFYVIMELKIPREKEMVISHIAKEEVKKKAKEYAEKIKQSAVKAGNYAYGHREEIKKGAVIAAEVAPLII